MGKSKVVKTSNIHQNVSQKQKNKNNLEKNEKTSDIPPSIAKNIKSENNKPIMENILDDNDFYSEEEYSQEEDDYSDKSYEFDEAETAQEAFESKYYHNRRTSNATYKNSYTNKISLKKVNNLLANQNIMVIDKNQLTETINNSNLLSVKNTSAPQSIPIQNNNQTNTEPGNTASTNTQSNGSNNINLTVLCSNVSLTTNSSNSLEKVNEKEATIQTQKKENNEIKENVNNITKGKKVRKSSKVYENSNSTQYVTEDNDGFIKSKKAKSKKLNSILANKINNSIDSSDQLNQTSSSQSSSGSETPIQNQPTIPLNNRGSIQISVDKKQIQILYGSKSTPIKISENKNLAIIVNPSSVQESDIQELLASPTKSRSKNNKPSIPVISSSPYTRNHNKNNNNNNNNNNNFNNNNRTNSQNKTSSRANELSIPTRKNKNSIIAKSPLFVGSYPPSVNIQYNLTSNKMNKNSIDHKYNLLNEYNMKKSASPVEKSSKNRFLKDESELNNEQQPKLSKKERKAMKKLQKNKKFDEEYNALNNTRKTYIVDGGDDEVYRSIFGAKCDTESEEEISPTKKNSKNRRLSKQQSQQSQQSQIDADEKSEIQSKKNKKKTQKIQQEKLDEEVSNVSNKKKNRKNSKNNNKDIVLEEKDNDGSHRKHSKKSKHQELEFNIEDINEEDDFFNVTSSIKNKKNKKGARN